MDDTPKNKYRFMDAELDRRIHSRQLRVLRHMLPLNGIETRVNGRAMLNFSSNDYLGLSMHPLVRQRSIEFIHQYGAGATASRLICGNYDYYDRIEKKLARLKQVEAALVMSSGFQTNISVIPALADRDSLILSDLLNHNSLVQGCRLARCKVAVYRHNDLGHLEQMLAQNSEKGFSRVFIVTESVFSMDGDQADIGALVALAERFNAFLVVDEAHATGVLGHLGMGLSCGHDVDLVIGTFGKAGGSFGAYLACSEKMKQYMINCCSGLIYSTALPPAVMGAVDAALELIPAMDAQRNALHANADYLRQTLQEMGWSTGQSSTQIIPVMIGKESEALAVSEWLGDNGILIAAIRPPTVPPGASRIRLSLSARHTRDHIDRLLDMLDKWRFKQ
ncbi:MAG: 8-amino-7-oxononanoate synthase [Desulfobacterales bacterium CG23_combo_of_CG06-09_8_20_14_all_51_8]|nr:MAG: 8-amino-7-oxononanoate synthase [Desulfobacterales bacterium CG23_combo_of_CG06-09_8_20_14_all_51_8]